MKVLLINPPYLFDVYNTDRDVTDSASIKPPLGLAYLAAVLERNNIDVSIIDANAEQLNLTDILKRISILRPDIIGFTASTVIINKVYTFIREIKKRFNVTIVVGGPHSSALPKKTLQECPEIDFVIIGEGEISFLNLIKCLENNDSLSKIKGICFRDGEHIRINEPQQLIKNLDSIPFPARHLLPLTKYRIGALFNKGFTGNEIATMITGRGCPNKCTYCSSAHFWKILRLRSAKNVVDEIEHLIKTYNVKHIDFHDDTFNISEKRVFDILNLLEERKLKFIWTCLCRVNNISDELVKRMKDNGCFSIQFGVESGVQRILDSVNKNIDLKEVERAVKIVKKHGLKVMTDFMIGFPNDTVETVNETIDYAIRLDPDLAFFSITTPFPGTQMYEYYKKEKLINNENWYDFSLHNIPKIHTKNLTSEQIFKLYRRAISKFYLRPKFFVNVLKRILHHPDEFKSYYSLSKSFLR